MRFICIESIVVSLAIAAVVPSVARADGTPSSVVVGEVSIAPAEAPPPPPADRRDPLIPASLAELATGGVATIAGAALWGAAGGPKECGLGGCIHLTSQGLQRSTGTFVLGAGLGFSVASAISLGVTLGRPIAKQDWRANGATATAGEVLTVLSVSMLGGSLVEGFGARNQPGFMPVIAPLVLGGLASVIGVPLLVTGSRVRHPVTLKAGAGWVGVSSRF